MAALIEQATGLAATIEVGGRGELSVWVEDRKVAEKSYRGFPTDDELVAAVKAALG